MDDHQSTIVPAPQRTALLEARPEDMGYVYVLQAGEYFKIGITRDLHSRIKTLKIQLPFRVRVAFACEVPFPRLAESSLHEHFSEHRSNGEWFRLRPEDVFERLNRLAAGLAEINLPQAYAQARDNTEQRGET